MDAYIFLGACKSKFEPQIHQSYVPYPLRYEDGVLILDKTGRFQKFDRSGKNSEVMAQIDSYIGNGFVGMPFD